MSSINRRDKINTSFTKNGWVPIKASGIDEPFTYQLFLIFSSSYELNKELMMQELEHLQQWAF